MGSRWKNKTQKQIESLPQNRTTNSSQRILARRTQAKSMFQSRKIQTFTSSLARGTSRFTKPFSYMHLETLSQQVSLPPRTLSGTNTRPSNPFAPRPSPSLAKIKEVAPVLRAQRRQSCSLPCKDHPTSRRTWTSSLQSRRRMSVSLQRTLLQLQVKLMPKLRRRSEHDH